MVRTWAVEAAGWTGSALLVGAFALNGFGALAPGPLYFALNLAGAAGVGVHAATRRSWPAVAVEVVWCGVAIAGLVGGG